MNRKQYEDDLRKRQEAHLKSVKPMHPFPVDVSPIREWIPCLHDSCSACLGTGIKHDGSMCVHAISCPCPKCTPMYSSNYAT